MAKRDSEPEICAVVFRPTFYSGPVAYDIRYVRWLRANGLWEEMLIESCEWRRVTEDGKLDEGSDLPKS